MKICRTFLNVGLVTLLLVPSAVKVSHAAQDSVVVGRLFGTVQPLPMHFQADMFAINNKINPEFQGFRIVHGQSGKKIKIFPDSRGYLSKSLGPGTWTFERLRNDRPGGEGPKVLEIMIFDVPSGSLVNLGTIIIVVDGKPTERLRIKKTSEQGTYVYTYRYVRSDSADDNTWPLDNLKRKNSKTLEKYQDSIVEVKDPITTELDSSRVILRVP